jgi:toxin ParE1/3/4
MAKYILTNQAVDDLVAIYEFGLIRFGAKQASAFMDALDAQFSHLANWPMAHPLVPHLVSGIRLFSFENHAIYYRVKSDVVVIVAVVGRQDERFRIQ